ncbi:hypothetical protein GE21DRAFT_1278244 [Neurospora crassa]|nr:hypothetical protein GE21DRAFT_1278244 [Neurospora crassa]
MLPKVRLENRWSLRQLTYHIKAPPNARETPNSEKLSSPSSVHSHHKTLAKLPPN